MIYCNAAHRPNPRSVRHNIFDVPPLISASELTPEQAAAVNIRLPVLPVPSPSPPQNISEVPGTPSTPTVSEDREDEEHESDMDIVRNYF
jgi:hypothetical protein